MHKSLWHHHAKRGDNFQNYDGCCFHNLAPHWIEAIYKIATPSKLMFYSQKFKKHFWLEENLLQDKLITILAQEKDTNEDNVQVAFITHL